ncbi:MAG TPA: protoporphyrinogen oxidase [Pseudonocardia sp.]|nr:protoporphyrinogen oxidase [Pseudonocardia sp.]
MSQVVVVGGGVTGLAAARRLALAGLEVTVLEAGSRWGGKLAPVVVDGVRLDGGAESMLARRPQPAALVDALGRADALVHPTSAKPAVLVGGQLHRLPPSVLGVPTDVDQLRGLLTGPGYALAAGEADRPAPELDHDVSIGGYVDSRFGPEVTDRLLEPLLGGVYAGRARDLSFAAVAPDLFARAAAGGSLGQHARAASGTGGTGPVFAGLRDGVATLIDFLVDDLTRLGVTLRLGVTVRVLDRTHGRFRLTAGPVPQPETIFGDGVLLAAPAKASARLLSGVGVPTEEFGRIAYASVAVITLVVRGLPVDRSGVLVPPGGLPTVKALTYSSAKWGWVADRAATRWGPDVSVVRASVGRAGEAAVLQLGDTALLERTFAEARTVPGWSGAELGAGAVSRWGGALPQYAVGHRDLVARLRAALTGVPGVALAGAALDGVGIAACLASADDATAKITADLGFGVRERIPG